MTDKAYPELPKAHLPRGGDDLDAPDDKGDAADLDGCCLHA